MSHHQCLQSVDYLFFVYLWLHSGYVIWVELIWGADHAEKKTPIIVCREKDSFTRGLGEKIGHLHDDVILLLQPESFKALLSFAN